MPDVAKDLTDRLLRRVRDIHGLAHSRDFARGVLSGCQRVLNTLLGVVTVTPTLTTQPHQLFYSISGFFIDTEAMTKVMAVREDTRDLCKLDNMRALNHLDLHWVRAIGPRFEAWTQVGRDLLVIYPSKTASSSVTIIGAKLTTALTGEDTAMELPNEYHDHVISLAEVMLLLKQRDLYQASRQLTRLLHALPTDVVPTRLHINDLPGMVNAGTVKKVSSNG